MSPTASPLFLSTAQPDFQERFTERLHWSAEQDEAIEQRVKDILREVRARGDEAVLAFTARFDRLPAASKAQALARLALLDYEAGERKQGMETERQFRQALPQAGGAAAEEQVRFLVESGLVFAERARHAGALAEAEAWLRSVGLVVLR